MAREFPIHNGRMTTDLDANGHRIKNLPPGSGFTQVQSDWGQTDTTAPDFIKNKPTIPAPVTIDTALSPTSENPVQNKAVAAALDGKRGKLDLNVYEDAVGWTLEHEGTVYGTLTPIDASELPNIDQQSSAWYLATDEAPWFLIYNPSSGSWMLGSPAIGTSLTTAAPVDAAELTFELGSGEAYAFSLTRVSPIPTGTLARMSDLPTKTSDLDNDGDGTNAFVKTNDTRLSDARTPTAHTHAMADVTELNAALVQKASLPDLPYRMVTPGEWEFSDGGTYVITGPDDNGEGVYVFTLNYAIGSLEEFSTEAAANSASSLTFDKFGTIITATRASLPGHLCDRANNLIDAQTSNVTLTLPQFEAGKVRDLLVACTIGLDGNDEPWSVIFQGADGEEISFKAEGDDAASATFPVPTAAGDWWYSLTERAPHVFAVSLKQLQSVSQTQGGS